MEFFMVLEYFKHSSATIMCKFLFFYLFVHFFLSQLDLPIYELIGVRKFDLYLHFWSSHMAFACPRERERGSKQRHSCRSEGRMSRSESEGHAKWGPQISKKTHATTTYPLFGFRLFSVPTSITCLLPSLIQWFQNIIRSLSWDLKYYWLISFFSL